jgi:hypothetical protein
MLASAAAVTSLLTAGAATAAAAHAGYPMGAGTPSAHRGTLSNVYLNEDDQPQVFDNMFVYLSI